MSKKQAATCRRSKPDGEIYLPPDLSFNSAVWDTANVSKNSQGYIFRYFMDRQHKMHSKMEHILVWERVNQKEVPKGYCIHHRDGNPSNNRAENLLCMPVLYHMELHATFRRASAKSSGLALEVTRQRIIEQYVEKVEYSQEIWSLVQTEIEEMGYL